MSESESFTEMQSLQTRIFVLPQEPHETFVETLVGRTIAPLCQVFSAALKWFWFTRYTQIIGQPGEDRGDCDFDAIPPQYKLGFVGNPPLHRSVRFRFGVIDDAAQEVVQSLGNLIAANGYAHSGVIEWNQLNDAGSGRFLATENTTPARQVQRAALVTEYYYSICRLFSDALVGPDENNCFRLETNSHEQNPNKSTFESLHHIFCNITEPPLDVLIDTGISVGTRIYPPAPKLIPMRVRF